MGPPSPTSRRRSKPFASPPPPQSPDSDMPPARGKRMKQEDIDPTVDTHDPSIVSTTSSNSNGRASTASNSKRKTKGRALPRLDGQTPADDTAPEDEDNGGVTRCICGREDDPDAGEFMVQCETCKVWQHGLCMGYDSEAQLHDDDYYCEQCRPDFHTDHLRKSRRKPRHSSANAQRQSRSHSPSLLKQPSKRRNTMNSRDAAFDENLEEILKTTAAEAGVVGQEATATTEMEEDAAPNRKKRKRNEEEAPPKKRTRSASSASDVRMASAAPREETPPPAPAPKPAAKNGARRRGGQRKVVDGEEAVPPLVKRGGARAKGTKRAAAIPAAAATNGQSTSTNANYRNYPASQQPMFTSWGLPDYLSHLEQMLPTDIPQPLEVLSGGPSASASRGGSMERTIERGVKVKWPSKRMSVGDMNKRVRALVEWVGREQASASERNKRRQALAAALQEEIERDAAARAENPDNDDNTPDLAKLIPKYDDTQALNAVRLLEELMTELIRFQEAY